MCHKFENRAIGSQIIIKKKYPNLFSKEIFALTREIGNPTNSFSFFFSFFFFSELSAFSNVWAAVKIKSVNF